MRPYIGRKLLITIAALFFFASLALALHHDDRPFQAVSCSICKIKCSTAGTPQKVKADAVLFATVIPSLVPEACLVYAGRVPESVVSPLPSKPFFAYTNKAPPVRL